MLVVNLAVFMLKAASESSETALRLTFDDYKNSKCLYEDEIYILKMRFSFMVF